MCSPALLMLLRWSRVQLRAIQRQNRFLDAVVESHVKGVAFRTYWKESPAGERMTKSMIAEMYANCSSQYCSGLSSHFQFHSDEAKDTFLQGIAINRSSG